MKKIGLLGLTLGTLIIILSSPMVVSANSNNVKAYKSALTKICNSSKDDDRPMYYTVKFDKNTGTLNIRSQQPWRYDGTYWDYVALKAANKARSNDEVQQVSLRSDNNNDKRVFNINDIKNLTFSEKAILQDIKVNHPNIYDDVKNGTDGGDIEDRYENYLEDQLYPKATYYKSYEKDDNE